MYTVVNCSVLTIYVGLSFLTKLKVTSSSESLISAITFKSEEFNIDTELKHNTADDSWELSFASVDTAKMTSGKGFYRLGIDYKDGTKEEKPYIGRLFVKEPEDEEDGA